MSSHPISSANLFSPALDRYAVSKLAAVVFAAFCFVGWPVKPPKNLQPSDIHDLIGKPTFSEPRTSRMSDASFYVNSVRLNCSLGMLNGLNGCSLFRDAITDEMPVKATYFWMPTRVGIRYRVLYRLEQNGKTVISPQFSEDYLMRSYDSAWASYLQLVGLFFFVTMTSVFIDCANARSRNVRVPGDVKHYQEH